MLRFYKKFVLSFFTCIVFFFVAYGKDEYCVYNLLEDEIELHMFYTWDFPGVGFPPSKGGVCLRIGPGEDNRFSYAYGMNITAFRIIVLSQPQKVFDVNSERLFSCLQDGGQKRTEDNPYRIEIKYTYCDPSILRIDVDGLSVQNYKKLPKKNKRKR